MTQIAIPYVVNPRIVRGLDYYTRTVFEFTSDALGAQSTVCAGGRYDGLVRSLGGPDTPAVGFALGIERFLMMIEAAGRTREPRSGAAFRRCRWARRRAKCSLPMCRLLRCSLDAPIFMDYDDRKLLAQLKIADRNSARYALVARQRGDCRRAKPCCATWRSAPTAGFAARKRPRAAFVEVCDNGQRHARRSQTLKELLEVMHEHDLDAIKVKVGDADLRNGPPRGRHRGHADGGARPPLPACCPPRPQQAPPRRAGAPANTKKVTAPLVGVFYRSPSPDAEPFVESAIGSSPAKCSAFSKR